MFTVPKCSICFLKLKYIVFSGKNALWFAVKRLTTAMCISYRKIQRKVLHDGNSVIKVCTLMCL